MRLPRRRAVVKWTLGAVCVLFAGAWLVSRWYKVDASLWTPRRVLYVILANGRVRVQQVVLLDCPVVNQWLWRAHWAPVDPWDVGWSWLPEEGGEARPGVYDTWHVTVPDYAAFVPLALPAAVLFYRDRRSVRWTCEGRCARCGYDLAGVSGRCPECGRVNADISRTAQP
jgi:hypothetical protein